MDNDSLFFRKIIIVAGGVIVSGSLGILIFEWLGSSINENVIAGIAGAAGGIVWQIEKRLLLDKTSKGEK